MNHNLKTFLSNPSIKKTDIAHYLCTHYNGINLTEHFFWIWDGEELKSNVASDFINNVISNEQKKRISIKKGNNDCPIISKGMTNFGNVCYMSSALQMLYSCNIFREKILNLNIQTISEKQKKYKYNKNQRLVLNKYEPKHINNINNGKIVASSIKKIFQKIYNENNGKYINYEDEYNIFFNIVMNDVLIFNNTKTIPTLVKRPKLMQEDSREFLNNLLGIFEEYNISKIFKFSEKYYYYNKPINFNNKKPIAIKDMINMSISEQSDVNRETFLFIELNKNILNIQSYINKFTDEEIMNKDEQYSYKETFRNFKRKEIIIPSENKYLLFLIKRFNVINEKKVFFNIKCKICNDIVISNVKYKLIGAIIYTGGGEGGHYIYITFCENDIYYIYNDSSATPFTSMTNNDKENYKKLIDICAYIILYERI